MPKRLLLIPLLIVACGSPRGDRDAAASDSAPPGHALAATAVAFRVPVTGGPLSIYALPALETTPWGSGSRLAGARRAVGMDLPGRRLLFLDSTDAVASFDLVSLRQKTIAPRRATATIAADGSLLAVDSSGAVTESQPWGSRPWSGSIGRGARQVFAAPGPRLLVVRRSGTSDSLLVVTRENGITQSVPAPGASDVKASRDGDAVAFATDSGLVVYEISELSSPWVVKLEGRPRAVAFSPSGHRVYVALAEKSELKVIDRFSRRERSTITLPGPGLELRPDPWGRAILVRGTESGDGDIWVVGVAKNEVIGRLRGSWREDLPAAAQSGVILVREGSGVVARDLYTGDSLAAVANGASDIWFAGRWVPTSAVAGMRAAAAQDPKRSQPETRPTQGQSQSQSQRPTATSQQPTANAPASFWIQLTATREEQAARALVAELKNPYAQVVAPRTSDDSWRVMVGPFWTREAADSAGRSIGRPYWVLDRSREPRQ